MRLFGRRKVDEKIESLQRKVRELEGLEKKLKETQDNYQELDRRVRELANGGGMNSLVREATEKIDLELLKKEIIAALKDRLISFGKEEMETIIKDHDFSADVNIDDDKVVETVAEKLAAEMKNSIPMDKLVEEIARQLIEGESLNTSAIENEVSETITNRLTISLKSD